MKKNNTICFVAGRSGGHIIPALTLAKKHKQKHKDASILFFSTHTELDKKITKNKIITWYKPLKLGNIPYKKLYLWPQFFFHFFKAFFVAFYFLFKTSPSKVVSTGGYIALPVCIAAKVLYIPIELFELNVLPGKTTQFLAPFAQTINICFKGTKKHLKKYNCIEKEYPISFEKNSNNSMSLPSNFSAKKKTVLILGGSQGSLFINNTVKKWIQEKKHHDIQIIHQTGANDTTDWQSFYNHYSIAAVSFAFSSAIEKYYKIADLIICRSGAGTLFETQFFNKKCITIPLATKTNTHQIENAKSFVKQYKKMSYILQKTILDDPKSFSTLVQNKISNKA